MDANLIERIALLSEKDPKSLLGVVLKLAEETGTLSQKMLAYEGCSGSNHRFVERHNLLDDACDIILVAMSLVHKLGYTHDDLLAHIPTKVDKWARLQAREEEIKYPLPYEIHITVEEAENDLFRETCKGLGVKPIVLALQLKCDGTLRDVMTSSVHMGTNQTALLEVSRISAGLRAAGLNVVREKIETIPWHPMAPSSKNGVREMPAGCYFESHFNVIVSGKDYRPAADQYDALKALAFAHNAHLSRNAFKQLSDDAFTLMLTLRTYEGTREDFQAQCSAIAHALSAADYPVEKTIVEFAMYDTKVHHDAEWLKKT